MSLTLNAKSEFFAVNDDLKPVKGLYLTPVTMDAHFLSQWVRAGESGWGTFVLNPLMKYPVPSYFPLRELAPGYLPEQMFLTDWPRWNKINP